MSAPFQVFCFVLFGAGLVALAFAPSAAAKMLLLLLVAAVLSVGVAYKVRALTQAEHRRLREKTVFIVPVFILTLTEIGSCSQRDAFTGWGYFLTIIAIAVAFVIRGSMSLDWKAQLALARKANVATAPERYVRLEGAAVPLGRLLHDPVSDKPCLWFRVETYRNVAESEVKKGPEFKAGETISSQPFGLRDATGTCAVAPEGAEFQLDRAECVEGGLFIEHRVWRIEPGDALQVVGQMTGEAVAGAESGRTVSVPGDGKPFVIRRTTDTERTWPTEREEPGDEPAAPSRGPGEDASGYLEKFEDAKHITPAFDRFIRIVETIGGFFTVYVIVGTAIWLGHIAGLSASYPVLIILSLPVGFVAGIGIPIALQIWFPFRPRLRLGMSGGAILLGILVGVLNSRLP